MNVSGCTWCPLKLVVLFVQKQRLARVLQQIQRPESVRKDFCQRVHMVRRRTEKESDFILHGLRVRYV